MIKEPTLQLGIDKMIPRHVFHKPFTVRFLDRNGWGREFIPVKREGLVCCIDGSKANEGTGAGVYGRGMRQRFSFRLGHYTTVFEAEVYAIRMS
jgi:hypothetical protein